MLSYYSALVRVFLYEGVLIETACMIKPLLIAFVVCLGSITAHAQVNKIFVQGDYHDIFLTDFLEGVQSKNNIRFHYVNEVVKDVKVSGMFKYRTPIMQALETLLQSLPISAVENGEGGIVLYANRNKPTKTAPTYFTVSGNIKDKKTGAPLPFVTVHIPGSTRGTVSDENGSFRIKGIPNGPSLLQFSYVGYETVIKKVDMTEDVSIGLWLEESARELQELVISPSTFEISTIEATPLTLGKEEILHSPNMGKDIYRTLRALPGIANNDFSAKARVRGGHSDETAVYLDNFLINEAFHLDEVDGTFSIFNTDYIDELKVLTGGFSARYADRMSGVIDVRTYDNLEADKYRFSIDLLNASFLAQKKINPKTNIFFNARRGYLDFLLSDMSDDTDVIDPRFSDLWTKVTHKPNSKNNFTFNFLFGHDNFLVKELSNQFAHLDVRNIRNNINGWMNWKWFPSEKYDALTTVGYQGTHEDATFAFTENVDMGNVDRNHSEALVLTHNSYYHANDRSNFEFGTELRVFNAAYVYREQRYDVFNSTPDDIIMEDIDFQTDAAGYMASAYIQFDHRFFDKITLQPGLRLSSQNYSPGLKWAPRFAVSYDISPTFNTRWAYGIYYQPDLYFRLRTAQSQASLYDYNARAVHYTGSFSFSRNKTNVMLNLYHKEYDELFDDYRYEFFNRIGGVALLDIPFNTKTGYARGLEIMVRQNYGKASLLSVSYAYSESRIRDAAGRTALRDFDQPHCVIVNNIFRLPEHWNISLLWSYHTGYPYTPTKVDFVSYRPQREGVILFYEAGAKNSERVPSFQSLDMRIEKTWFFGKSRLTAYVNVINFFNRENIRSYWWYPYTNRSGSMSFARETQVMIPSFVSPGVSFTIF